MEETLKELKEVYSSNLIIVVSGNYFRIYDEDAKIIEYCTNLLSRRNVLICQYKYIDNIKELLKKNKINYVILDKDNNYKSFDYYYSEYNKYNNYLKRSKRFNLFRKIFICFYNSMFGLPLNRYK